MHESQHLMKRQLLTGVRCPDRSSGDIVDDKVPIILHCQMTPMLPVGSRSPFGSTVMVVEHCKIAAHIKIFCEHVTKTIESTLMVC